MKAQTLKSLLAGALLLVGSQTALRAQEYSIGWDAIAGGGGTSFSSQYTLSGTIGQWDAGGPRTGGHESVNGGFWQTPGGPPLIIRFIGPAKIMVSWPATALGCFVLQSTGSLSAPNWVTVPLAVTYANGIDSVVLTTSMMDQFYRLVSDCQDQ